MGYFRPKFPVVGLSLCLFLAADPAFAQPTAPITVTIKAFDLQNNALQNNDVVLVQVIAMTQDDQELTVLHSRRLLGDALGATVQKVNGVATRRTNNEFTITIDRGVAASNLVTLAFSRPDQVGIEARTQSIRNFFADAGQEPRITMKLAIPAPQEMYSYRMQMVCYEPLYQPCENPCHRSWCRLFSRGRR